MRFPSVCLFAVAGMWGRKCVHKHAACSPQKNLIFFTKNDIDPQTRKKFIFISTACSFGDHTHVRKFPGSPVLFLPLVVHLILSILLSLPVSLFPRSSAAWKTEWWQPIFIDEDLIFIRFPALSSRSFAFISRHTKYTFSVTFTGQGSRSVGRSVVYHSQLNNFVYQFDAEAGRGGVVFRRLQCSFIDQHFCSPLVLTFSFRLGLSFSCYAQFLHFRSSIWSNAQVQKRLNRHQTCLSFPAPFFSFSLPTPLHPYSWRTTNWTNLIKLIF